MIGISDSISKQYSEERNKEIVYIRLYFSYRESKHALQFDEFGETKLESNSFNSISSFS